DDAHGLDRHADDRLDHERVAGGEPRAELDHPGLRTDQLDHHHRARAPLSEPAHRDRFARPAARAGVRRCAHRRSLHGLATEFGVQWQGGHNIGNGQSVVGGTNCNTAITNGLGTNILGAAANPGTLGPGLNLGLIKGTIKIPGTDTEIVNLQVLARALEGDSSANVLSTPNVLTLDNEEAKIIVGQNVPFITGSYTPAAGSATNPFQTIERKDIGLTLRVTPTVSEAGGVKLKIFQEVSSVTRDKILVGSADIITNKRSLESTVLVDSGQIVVLGGLIQDDQQSSVDKVPLLGDIPWIGALFKYESRSRKRTNLMVFLRPVIVKDERGAAAITADRYEYIRNLQSDIKLPWNG